MRILIVEGNTAEASALLQAAGLAPYAPAYAAVLISLDSNIVCEIAYPCERPDGGLPDGRRLEDFDGIVWTGSSLCISEGDSPPVAAQIALAQRAFASRVPVFGSCWGMQVMTQALGGSVQRNPRGREIGLARHVQLTAAGAAHPMYAGKPRCFDALASHRDEVVSLPQGATLLAGNTHSPVQAISMDEDGCSFWGVQYHPEFDLETVANLMQLRGKSLVEEGFFADAEDLHRHTQTLLSVHQDLDRREHLAWQLGITSDVIDPACRYREIINWLHTQVKGGS